MCLSFTACSDGDEVQVIPEYERTVLNVGYGAIGGEFNPFYASEGADADVCADGCSALRV